MAHRAGDELNVVLAGLVFELINLGVVEAVHQIGRAEGEILVVAIFDQIAHRLPRQIVGQVAADLLRQGELAVRERARSRPALHDAAGLAAHAMAGLARRAVAAVDAAARIHDQHARLRRFLLQFQSGEDARRTRSDDDDVKFAHWISLHLNVIFDPCRFSPHKPIYFTTRDSRFTRG